MQRRKRPLFCLTKKVRSIALGGKVAKERPPRDARRLRNVVDRRLVEALFGEQVGGRIPDCITHELTLAVVQRGRAVNRRMDNLGGELGSAEVHNAGPTLSQSASQWQQWQLNGIIGTWCRSVFVLVLCVCTSSERRAPESTVVCPALMPATWSRLSRIGSLPCRLQRPGRTPCPGGSRTRAESAGARTVRGRRAAQPGAAPALPSVVARRCAGAGS